MILINRTKSRKRHFLYLSEFKEMFLIKIALGIPFEIKLNSSAIATDKFIGFFSRTEYVEVDSHLASVWGERIDPCGNHIVPLLRTWSEKDWENVNYFVLKEKLVRNDPVSMYKLRRI